MIVFVIFGVYLISDKGFAGNLNIATLTYPPFQYEENGKPKGVLMDGVKEVFSRLKQNYFLFHVPSSILDMEDRTLSLP